MSDIPAWLIVVMLSIAGYLLAGWGALVIEYVRTGAAREDSAPARDGPHEDTLIILVWPLWLVFHVAALLDLSARHMARLAGRIGGGQ